MKVFVTPAANKILNSNIDDAATRRLIGYAMRFEEQLEYRQNHFLLKIDPKVKPIIHLRNGKLALQHMVTEDIVLLFIPPEKNFVPHADHGLAGSIELNIT